MRPRPHLAAVAFPVLAALATVGAAAVPTPVRACRTAPSYSVEVLVDGHPREELAGNGATYIEAARGREYSIRLTNRTGERVAVALAVDGLNAIDARHTTAQAARKWILDPWQSITLDGWQTSAATARRFVFTSEAKSYGGWLGRTSDLGVISAAFFRERVSPPVALDKPATSEPFSAPQRRKDAGAAEGSARQDSAAKESGNRDELAATGIGHEIEHRVMEVDFDEEPNPAHVVTLRYEYRDALVTLGVLPRPDADGALARRERARGFSGGGFAPDPYRN